MFNKLKIVSLGDMKYRVYLNDNEITCKKLELKMEAREIPYLTLTMPADDLDIEIDNADTTILKEL